jgi:hypothetical protein
MAFFDNFSIASKALTWKQKLVISAALLLAILIALASAYFVGYSKGKHISKDIIAGYELNKANLETKLRTAQAKVTTQTVTEYITKVAYQDRVIYQNRDIIRTLPQVPFDNTVSKGFVYTHNRLAGAEPINFDLASDTRPSGIQNTVVLDTVAHNYNVGQKAIIQLESLQKWIKEQWETSKKVADEETRNNH